MTNEELKELEIIVEKFDNIDINNLNSLRNLKYSKIPSEKLLKLVELAKQNNKRALTILVKYYYPFILSIVFNYLCYFKRKKILNSIKMLKLVAKM